MQFINIFKSIIIDLGNSIIMFSFVSISNFIPQNFMGNRRVNFIFILIYKLSPIYISNFSIPSYLCLIWFENGYDLF